MFNLWDSQFTLAESMLAKSHALIITSPPGHGAYWFAQRLAQRRLCEAQATEKPCFKCPACHWFEQDSHPDFRLLSPESAEPESQNTEGEAAVAETKKSKKAPSEIAVGAVRALSDFVQVGSHRRNGRVILVAPAHAMTTITANTLLKTLEEPTARLLFLLATESPGKLLATIRSRCQILTLPAIAIEAAAAWLSQEATMSAAEAKSLLQASGGAPFTALAQSEPENAAIHRLVIEALAGLPDTGLVDSASALQEAEPVVVFRVLQRWLEDLARVAVGGSPRFFPDRQQRLQSLVSRAKLSQRMAQLMSVASEIERDRRLSTHPLNWRLFCEQTLLRYCELYRV